MRKRRGRTIRGRPIKDPNNISRKSIKRVNRFFISLMINVGKDLKPKLTDSKLSDKEILKLVTNGVNKYKRTFELVTTEEFERMNKKIIEHTTKETNDSIKTLLNKVNKVYNSANSLEVLKKLAKNGETSEVLYKKISKIVGEATLENVKLIKSLDVRLKYDLYKTIKKSYEEGVNPAAAIQKLIVEAQEKPLYSVRLLVSNQANRLNDAITRSTLMAGGFTHYIWKHGDSKDPRPAHLALDGTIQPLDKSASGSEENGGLYPGVEPNCSCYLVPVLGLDPVPA